ncbi:MAG: hypothetical protein PVI38_05150 [Desulfobacterales bacterium]|jgi:hypothetical protein
MLKKWKITYTFLLLLLAFSVSSLAGDSKVSVSNFKILSFGTVWGEAGTLKLIGEVKNIGSIAAGVQLEAVARDANGKLVLTAIFWPNSTNNIPPEETAVFKIPLSEGERIKNVQIEIIRAQVWQ